MSIRKILLLLTMVVITGVMPGCQKPDEESFRMDQGIFNFQFEHPADYEIIHLQVSGNISPLWPSAVVSLFMEESSNITRGKYWVYDQAVFFIHTSPAYRIFSGTMDDEDKVAKWADHCINTSSSMRREGFLISKEEICIDTMYAVHIKYSYQPFTASYNPDQHVIAHEVYFIHDGLLWSITMTANESISEETDAAFDRIITTFTFLEDKYQDKTGNRKFTFKEGDNRFSCTLNSRYELDVIQLQYDQPEVYLCSPSVFVDGMDTRSLIEIITRKPDDLRGAKALDSVEDILERLESGTNKGYQEFELLSRREIRVDGLTACELVYSCGDNYARNYSWYPASWGLTDYTPRRLSEYLPTVNKVVYFDYNGLIWEITVKSNPDTFDLDEKHFDTIVRSFRMLD